MNLPHHRRSPLQRLHQQLSTLLHLPSLPLLRLTRLRTRIPRSNLSANPLTHTTDPLTQTSRTLSESILQRLGAGFPENQFAFCHASAPHPASNPRTRRHKTLPLLPFDLRHITINSHQRIRIPLKISSKRPQRIRPPGYHITQNLRRRTSHQRRMLRHNTHQQRQAILGLITSPRNNSSRTLLSPKLQLHMGTHVAPLSHASDPQNHKTLPPSPYPTKQITPTPTPTTSPKPVEPFHSPRHSGHQRPPRCSLSPDLEAHHARTSRPRQKALVAIRGVMVSTRTAPSSRSGSTIRFPRSRWASAQQRGRPPFRAAPLRFSAGSGAGRFSCPRTRCGPVASR